MRSRTRYCVESGDLEEASHRGVSLFHEHGVREAELGHKCYLRAYSRTHRLRSYWRRAPMR